MNDARQVADPEWKQLLRLGEQLVDQPTPTAQCALIIDVVGQLLAAQVRVWLASPHYPLPGSPPIETLPEAEATPLAHQALTEHKIHCDPPLPDEKPFIENGPRSVAIPLSAKGAILGVVQVDRQDDSTGLSGQAFSERELSFLEGLVAHAAVAMEITRLETLKNWRTDQLNLVRSVSSQIASLTVDDQRYERITNLIQKTFDFYYVAIFILDEGQRLLRFQGSASQNQLAPIKSGFLVHLGEGIIGTVAESGEELVAPNVHLDQHYRHLDGLPETLSEAALPLKVENQILGVLDFQSDQFNAFHENDMLVLRALADNIALAIESQHLNEDLQRRVEQISSVFEVSHALASILDLDELLPEVVNLIHTRFGYPFIHVFTVHPGRKLVIYQTGSGERSDAMRQQGWSYPLDAPQGLIPWVARNGKTFLANDVTKEPLYRPADLPPFDTRSELTVPLMVGEEVLGVLDLQSREPNAFDENDRSLFESLAATIAVAMRNAYLYRSELWRRKVAESFRDVAQLISSALPLNQLLDVILEKLESNLPCDASAIWLLEDGPVSGQHAQPGEVQHRLRLAATRNLEPENLAEALQDPAVRAMLERTAESEAPLIRHPDEPLGPLGAALRFSPDYSSIAVPMRTHNQSLGVLTLAHNQNGRYGSEALAITSTFAGYAAVAIDNARLYSETQEQALVSTMLLQVAEASQSILNVEDLLATMVRLTRLLMGVKKCAFLLWEDGLQAFEMKAWYGFDLAEAAPCLFPPQTPALAQLSDKRATLYLDDPEIELHLPEFKLPEGQGTIIMLPLLVRGEVIGAFLVGLQIASPAATETGFDPKALAILQGIAHQTALTVDNLRLLEARQEEAYVTAALLQVAQAVVSSNDLHDTLDTIVHLLPILVGIDTCVLYLWDAVNQLLRPTQVYAESRREEEQILVRPFAPDEHHLLNLVRTTGEMHMCQIPDPELSFEDWARLTCISHEQLIGQSSQSEGNWLLAYPLQMQGQVLGVLMVREANTSPTFWERRLEIIYGIAQQASLAIQNDLLRQEMVETERIEREIQLARQIQETFLPDTVPQFKHWELDLRWETAREVGGDFYDVFRLGENRLGLVIADVSDKGLPAALYMTVARTLIRANALENHSPANVLEEVNALLVSDSSDSMFITAVYMIISLDQGGLVYANAGHNRPLLYRAKNGEIEQLPKGGTALGILNDLSLENHHLAIQPGDALILYTDGVTDLLSPEGEAFGEPRLVDLLHAHGEESIHNILEALDDAFIEFRRGIRLADDITLVAIRREPNPRRNKKRRSPIKDSGEHEADTAQEPSL